MPEAPTVDNPLREGLERLPVHPTTLVIFGATGDLCHRKLLPAIYNLAHEGQLPERFNLIGTSRQEMTDDEFRAELTKSVKQFSRREPDEKVLDAMVRNVRYVPGNFDDPNAYKKIDNALKEYDETAGQTMNRCFYLSTAPMFFPVIVKELGDAKLVRDPHAEIRIVIEKPFGTALAEALALNKEVLSVFKESQVYRIDHYLGKETVQNVLAFRFANSLFEPIWNRNAIDSVQITASEDLGIGTRAGYYDGAGALRDLVQNHMMQLLTLIAMEPPVHFNADEIRDEKVKVLRSIHTPEEAEIAKMSVHARYTKGTVGGEDVPGYLQEKDVPRASKTETFAALRLEVDNWRCAGVPFYLRTGKRLARKVTEIAITLKPVPHLAFIQDGTVGVRPNQLVLTLQPNEGVSLSLGAKIPGTRMRIRPVNMEFLYGTAFMSQSPEAYERLILDAMRGDATLFTRNDEVEQQWRIIDPIIASWGRSRSKLPDYEAGSQGPEEAKKILLPGHGWRAI